MFTTLKFKEGQGPPSRTEPNTGLSLAEQRAGFPFRTHSLSLAKMGLHCSEEAA